MTRMGAGPLGILLGLSVGACFIKPDAPSARDDAAPHDGRTDDAPRTVDASPDAGPPPGCTRYDFDGVDGGACGGWGSSAYGSISISGGLLSITGQQSAGAGSAGCTSSVSTFTSVTFWLEKLPDTLATTSELFVSVSGVRYGARFDGDGFKPICGASEGLAVLWPGQGGVRIREMGTSIYIEYADFNNVWTPARECQNANIGNAVSGASVVRANAGGDATVVLGYVDVCP